MKIEYLKQAWLVLLLALIFAAALAGVQAQLQGRIDENKINETYDQIPDLVYVEDGGVRKPALQELTQELTIGGKKVYKAFRDEQGANGKPVGEKVHVGWVVRASGQGFADRIELLIGLDPRAERILGIYVLDQKETPGLGDKINPRNDWDDRFVGKSALEDLTVVKAAPKGNEIQAITGATVSSQSVCKIVNRAVIEFRNALITEKILTD